MHYNKGKLYICPTPIGNLEDITLRCLRILQEADLIAAEDTRITQKLLNHFQIKTPLISYHKFSEKKQSKIIIDKVLSGCNVALVTDSGTPLISDPGSEIILEARSNGIQIIPLPGASAVTCSLSAAGFQSNGFIFHGFLPKSQSRKAILLKSLSLNTLPVVIFESPNRVISTLETIYNVLGNINIFIAREITKLHEEFLSNRVVDLINHFKSVEPRGEFTIIIDNSLVQQEKLTREELELIINEKLRLNQSVSSIVKELAEDTTIKKNQLYKIVLETQNKTNAIDED